MINYSQFVPSKLNLNEFKIRFCYHNSTGPACKCFVHYSGVHCEIESDEVVKIRRVSTAAVAAGVIMVGGMFATLVSIDIFNLMVFLKLV